MLYFQCYVLRSNLCVKDMVPSLVVLGSDRNFKRWSIQKSPMEIRSFAPKEIIFDSSLTVSLAIE